MLSMTDNKFKDYVAAQALKPGIFEDAAFVVSHFDNMVGSTASIAVKNKNGPVQLHGDGDKARNVATMKFCTTYTASQMALFLNSMTESSVSGIKFFADGSGKFLCAMGDAELSEFSRSFSLYAESFAETIELEKQMNKSRFWQ